MNKYDNIDWMEELFCGFMTVAGIAEMMAVVWFLSIIKG